MLRENAAVLCRGKPSRGGAKVEFAELFTEAAPAGRWVRCSGQEATAWHEPSLGGVRRGVTCGLTGCTSKRDWRRTTRRCWWRSGGWLTRASKVLITLRSGYRESTESWKGVLRDARQRGLRCPRLVIGDGHLGLASVATDVMGKSGWDVVGAIIDGEQDPQTLAALARGRLQAKREQLEQALHGRVTDHHRSLLAQHCARIEFLDRMIADYDRRIDEQVQPFRAHPAPGPGSRHQRGDPPRRSSPRSVLPWTRSRIRTTWLHGRECARATTRAPASV